MFGSIHRVEDMLFLEVDILVSIDWLGDICVIFSLFSLQYLVVIFCWKFVVKLYLLSCKFCFYFTTCLPRLELSKVCVSARMLTMYRYNISNARSHFAIGPFRKTSGPIHLLRFWTYQLLKYDTDTVILLTSTLFSSFLSASLTHRYMAEILSIRQLIQSINLPLSQYLKFWWTL